MILFELAGSENHPVYQQLQIENAERQYSFMNSTISAALAMGRPFLSQTLLKAFNFHAVACLHTSAGQYRPCEVIVGSHQPIQHFRVQAWMDDFTNMVNRLWSDMDAVVLAAYVLWGINNVHPFENGNGRTARAAAYFVLCVRIGGFLPGGPQILEVLKADRREDYVAALTHADHNRTMDGFLYLQPMVDLLIELIKQQLADAQQAAGSRP